MNEKILYCSEPAVDPDLSEPAGEPDLRDFSMSNELQKLQDNEAVSIGSESVGSQFVVILEAPPLSDAGSDSGKMGFRDDDWARRCCPSMVEQRISDEMDEQRISDEEMRDRYESLIRRNKIPRVTSSGKFFLV